MPRGLRRQGVGRRSTARACRGPLAADAPPLAPLGTLIRPPRALEPARGSPVVACTRSAAVHGAAPSRALGHHVLFRSIPTMRTLAVGRRRRSGPSPEGAVECAHFGVAEQVSDLGQRVLWVPEVVQRGAVARLANEPLEGHAEIIEPSL